MHSHLGSSVMTHLAKRSRLGALARDSCVTQNALSKLLKKLNDEGLPDAFSTFAQRKEREAVGRQSSQFGSLMQKVLVVSSDGEPVEIWVQHPFAWLEIACKESGSFKDLLQSTLDRSKGRFDVIVYSDEITPGNPLGDCNDRKLQTIYWTVKQFPLEALCNELCWMTASTLTSKECESLAGGLSEIFKYVLRFFLGAATGHDLRSGIAFTMPGE